MSCWIILTIQIFYHKQFSGDQYFLILLRQSIMLNKGLTKNILFNQIFFRPQNIYELLQVPYSKAVLIAYFHEGKR